VIKFANDWLENNIPVSKGPSAVTTETTELSVSIPSDVVADVTSGRPTPSNDRFGAPVGSNAKLAEFLEGVPQDAIATDLSFKQIEALLVRSFQGQPTNIVLGGLTIQANLSRRLG
jgi:hypothetical protein